MGSDTSSETGKRSSQSGARAARLGRELLEPPQPDLVRLPPLPPTPRIRSAHGRRRAGVASFPCARAPVHHHHRLSDSCLEALRLCDNYSEMWT